MRIGTVQHVVAFARQMGLLSKTGLSLTDLGTRFYQFAAQSPNLFPEATHHLLYTTHVLDKSKRFSWAYARVVDAWWTSSERTLDSEALAQMVGMVVEAASQEFSVPVEQIAFSRDSIRGILNWLRALDPPPVINHSKQECFRRRHFCPPFAFLWAIDFVYRTNNVPYGVRLFFTPDRLETLCKLCVLDPAGLENVLTMAKRTSDYQRGGIFDHGTQGGFGRWILLACPCPVPKCPGDNQQ